MILPPYAMLDGKPRDPSEYQKAFHRMGSRGITNRYYLGGLGAGKTHAGAVEFMRRALSNAEYLQAKGETGGARYLIGAPTDSLVEAGAWTAINNWLTEFEQLNGYSLVDRIWTSGHRRIRLVSGDLLTFFTLKNTKVAAANAAGAWFDEGELADDPLSGFKGLRQRLRDSRLPTERRFLLITSTPWGSHVLHQHFSDKIAKGDGKYGIVHAPSSSNPGLPGDYVEDISAAMSAREKLELVEGRPQSADGAVFGMEYDKAASIDHAWNWRGARPMCSYYVGIDWGGHFHAVLIENDPIDPATGRECLLGGTDTVFDEVIADGVQTEAFLDLVFKRLDEYRLRGKVKACYADYNPTESVEIANGQRYFDRKCFADRINDSRDKEEGIASVRWRLADAKGTRRLRFAPGLRKTASSRGILACMENYARVAQSIEGVKVFLPQVRQESVYSHGPDALRAYCWPRYRHLRLHDARRR